MALHGKYIELKREDLQKGRTQLSAELIGVYDFRPSVLTREQIREAAVIVFIDDGDNKTHILKGKHSLEIGARNGTIFYFHGTKFDEFPWEHNDPIEWSNRLEIIDHILNAGYNVLVMGKSRTIMIDNKRFQQR